MLIDLNRYDGNELGEFDVCIIGAGAAGIALAVEMLRQGKRVLVLESGGTKYEEKTQSLYKGEVTGLSFSGFNEGRTRVLGGTTSEWGGQVLEMDDLDFRDRKWIPGSGWPIGKSDILPYYLRALDIEGLPSCLPTADEIWKSIGLVPPNLGSEIISDFSHWSPVPKFSKLYEKNLSEDPSVVVCLHANACEFEFKSGSGFATSVKCRTLDGKRASFNARSYVMCVGAIETCRLLLQPEALGKSSPWSSNKNIGRHFQEHISCFAADICDIQLKPVRGYFDYAFSGGYKYHPKMKLAPYIQEKYETLNVCGTVAFVLGTEDIVERVYRTFRLLRKNRMNEVSKADLWHFIKNIPSLAWHLIPYHISPWRAARLSSASLKLNVHCEQAPMSASGITLSEERDSLGLFRAKLDWQISDLEIASIQKYVEVIQRVFARQNFGRIVPNPSLLLDKDEFVKSCRESYHHMGGTRMAVSEAYGVVDPNLRVFGTQNLFICSCSVFPSSGFANPTHTLLALAARLAEHLKSGA